MRRLIDQLTLVVKRWRLYNKMRWRIRSQIKRNLMRGAGRGGGECTGPARLNWPMQMTAEDALESQGFDRKVGPEH